MSCSSFDLYFTGREDPRDGCIIIGEDTKPVFFRFETPEVYMTNARTTVYRNGGEIVAMFDWTMSTHFGLATIGNRTLPMSHLVMAGSSASARMFCGPDGRRFEWRKCADDAHSYDLYAAHSKQIASFRRYAQPTPVGPSHAYMQYTFQNDSLLLEALLALCLNRWIDRHGF